MDEGKLWQLQIRTTSHDEKRQNMDYLQSSLVRIQKKDPKMTSFCPLRVLLCSPASELWGPSSPGVPLLGGAPLPPLNTLDLGGSLKPEVLLKRSTRNFLTSSKKKIPNRVFRCFLSILEQSTGKRIFGSGPNFGPEGSLDHLPPPRMGGRTPLPLYKTNNHSGPNPICYSP